MIRLVNIERVVMVTEFQRVVLLFCAGIRSAGISIDAADSADLGLAYLKEVTNEQSGSLLNISVKAAFL